MSDHYDQREALYAAGGFDDLDAPHEVAKSKRHGFTYFVSGHTYFADGMDEPRPVNISSVYAFDKPLINEAGLDELTERVKQDLDREARRLGLTQEGYPTIREVNFLHHVLLDERGDAIRPL